MYIKKRYFLILFFKIFENYELSYKEGRPTSNLYGLLECFYHNYNYYYETYFKRGITLPRKTSFEDHCEKVNFVRQNN